jgi:uncharacterized repeat protein (TIGR01451 family)
VNGATVISLSSDVDWKAWEWHHIAVTWGTEGAHLYLDNKERKSSSYTGSIGIKDTFAIRSYDVNTIDELKIWKSQKSSFPDIYIPHITLKKTCDKKYTSQKGTLTYTITYTNEGNATAMDVAIIEVLPENCKLSTVHSP